MTMTTRRKRYMMLYNMSGGSPEDYIISNLGTGAWWHDTSSMYQDDAGTIVASANLDPVGKWDDLGPNAHHHYQSSLAAKPRINTNVLNGWRGVSFDGSDILATAGNMSISTFAVWAVTTTSSATTQVVYEHSTNSGAFDGSRLITSDFVVKRGANQSRKTAGVLLNGETAVLRHESNGTHATHNVYKNNALLSATTALSADVGAAVATQQFFVGARSGIVIPLTGRIYSLLVVSPYPDAAFIAYVDNYFANRYNIPLAA